METVGNLRAEEILEALDNEQRAVALATQLPIASHMPQQSEQWIRTKF
jgi:hypothetical protein